MIEFSDIPKLFLAFFIVLPVISLIHEFGHVIVAWLCGAHNIKIIIGSGKILYNARLFEIRTFYFYYGFCYFENIDENHRIKNFIIYSGGIVANCLSSLGLIFAIRAGWLESNIFTYQFLYFSLYYFFFSLLPMGYPDGNFSDGKILFNLIRRNHRLLKQKLYQFRHDGENDTWVIYNENGDELQAFDNYSKGYAQARERAKLNRPSKLEIIKSKSSQIEIFSRNPV